jgi:hypothetical protein
MRPLPLFLSSALLATSVFTAACTDDASDPTDKGEEEDVPTDGKLDSFRSPTYHGPIGFVDRVTAEIKATEKFHTWDFTLSGDASITLTTNKYYNSSRNVDTVLYLYKEGPTGWGPYIARNDDYGVVDWSQLKRNLGAGHYRALVKGYYATTYGKFGLRALCDGAGCAPVVEEPVCLLGEVYHDFRDGEDYTTYRSEVITSVEGRTPLELDQIVLAVQQSAHTDVTTAEEALERVDQNEIIVTERAGFDHILVSYEYGSGDNSYGAIFYYNTLDIAASIHDGDLYDCTFVTPSGGVAIGEDCRAESDCPDEPGVGCRGIAGQFGICNSTVRLDGDGDECDADSDCGDGQVCAGASRGYGLCGSAWLRGDFEGPGGGAIADGGALSAHVTAYGLATVDTDVWLRAVINHPTPATLKVYLRNPGGTENLAWDGATAGAAPGVIAINEAVGFSGDESVNGSWVVRIVDSAAGGGGGTLTSWGLTIGSRWD